MNARTWILTVIALAVLYPQPTLAVGPSEVIHYDPTPELPDSGDECVITVQGDEHSDAEGDVDRVAGEMRFLLDNSADMRSKVAGACSNYGFNINIVVFRDNPRIYLADTDDAGTILLDLEDIEDMSDHMSGSEADIDEWSLHSVTMILAHMFDHNLDSPTEPHDDSPPLLRGVRSPAVEDENRVLSDLGLDIFRNDFLFYDPRQTLGYPNGSFRVTYTVSGREVEFILNSAILDRDYLIPKVPGGIQSFTFSQELIDRVPDHICGGNPCPRATDTDLDGEDDSTDNCPNRVNPRQADNDGDGMGQGCDDDDDSDGVDARIESPTGSQDHDSNATPEHPGCHLAPGACGATSPPCLDGMDNDLDGRTDADDPGCAYQLPTTVYGWYEINPNNPEDYPAHLNQKFGGLPKDQIALGVIASFFFDHDLNGSGETPATAAGLATLRNDKPFETAGLTHLTGNWTGMWLEGTDPVLGDFVLSLPGADGTFELVAIQTGNELPATGQASFGYVMWTANFGMMQPNVAGLQSNSIPHWPMYDTAWTLTGPPQDLYPETSTIPVSRIESMTVNVRRDSDGDGISDHIDNCPFTHNILQEDDDIDGVGNACDCRPNDSSVQSTPPDATLFFLDVNTLAISADGPYGSDFDVFDVVQSNVPFDFLSGTCIATNFPFFATGVPIDSGPAIISYYLARYQNVCGDGPDHAGTGGVIVQIRECD